MKKSMQKSIFPQKIQKSFVYYNEQLVHKFKRNYLENYNDSEHAVKTKNALFFMNFLNINENWQLFPFYFIKKIQKFEREKNHEVALTACLLKSSFVPIKPTP